MSSRRRTRSSLTDGQKLSEEIEEFKRSHRGAVQNEQVEVASLVPPNAPSTVTADAEVGNRLGSSEFDKLDDTEKAAASLGVSPDEWKPIAWLNNGHFDALQRANVMDANLVRRIEAYKAVSEKSSS